MPPAQRNTARPAQTGRLLRYLRSGRTPLALAGGLAEEVRVRLLAQEHLRHAYGSVLRMPRPETFIFLVGCYNSGTTLFHRILASHPDIATPPREGVRFTRHLSNLENNGHHMVWDESWRTLAIPPGDTMTVASEVWRDWSVFHRRSALAFMDKSVANTARMAWLDEAFPGSRFIGLHRNGYCIAEGLYRRSRPPEWLKAKTGSDHYPLEMAGQQWVDSNTAMLDGLATVSRGLKMAFEDLIANPVETVSHAFDFLGLRPLAISQSGKILRVGARQFALHDPNPGSLKRLGADGMAELRPQLEPMMLKLGYSP